MPKIDEYREKDAFFKIFSNLLIMLLYVYLRLPFKNSLKFRYMQMIFLLRCDYINKFIH